VAVEPNRPFFCGPIHPYLSSGGSGLNLFIRMCSAIVVLPISGFQGTEWFSYYDEILRRVNKSVDGLENSVNLKISQNGKERGKSAAFLAWVSGRIKII